MKTVFAGMMQTGDAESAGAFLSSSEPGFHKERRWQALGLQPGATRRAVGQGRLWEPANDTAFALDCFSALGRACSPGWLATGLATAWGLSPRHRAHVLSFLPPETLEWVTPAALPSNACSQIPPKQGWVPRFPFLFLPRVLCEATSATDTRIHRFWGNAVGRQRDPLGY